MVKVDLELLKKHKKKIAIASIGVVALTTAGFGGNYYVQAKEQEKQEIKVKEEKKKVLAEIEVKKQEQVKLKEKLAKAEAEAKAEEERVKAEEEQKKAEEEKAKAEEQAKQEAEQVKQEEVKKVEEQKKAEESKQEEGNGNKEGNKQDGNKQEGNKQVQNGNKQGQVDKGEKQVAQGNVTVNEGKQNQPSEKPKENNGSKQQVNQEQPSKQVQQPANNGGGNVQQPQQPQQEQGTAMTRAVSDSSVGQRTNQIVAVVAQGSSAKVTFLEKQNGKWEEQFTTNGFVGSQGVGQASETVSRTPRGAHSLGFAFGTSNPGTNLPFRQITQNSYWISNVNDDQYNTWQERDSSSPKDEHMINERVAYKYGIVINYNTSNPVKGGGSGFFLHVSNGSPTAGCVSVPQDKMVQLMQRLHGGAYIVNVNSINEISNY